jgi:hypothetical protein
VTQSLTAKAAKDAKEKKSLTAKAAKDAEEKYSLTAKDAKKDYQKTNPKIAKTTPRGLLAILRGTRLPRARNKIGSPRPQLWGRGLG